MAGQPRFGHGQGNCQSEENKQSNVEKLKRETILSDGVKGKGKKKCFNKDFQFAMN